MLNPALSAVKVAANTHPHLIGKRFFLVSAYEVRRLKVNSAISRRHTWLVGSFSERLTPEGNLGAPKNRRYGEVVKFEGRLGTPTLGGLDVNSEQPKAGVEEQPETKETSKAVQIWGRLLPNFMPPLFDPVRRLSFVAARRSLRDVGIDEAGDHHAGERAPSGAFATLKTILHIGRRARLVRPPAEMRSELHPGRGRSVILGGSSTMCPETGRGGRGRNRSTPSLIESMCQDRSPACYVE